MAVKHNQLILTVFIHICDADVFYCCIKLGAFPHAFRLYTFCDNEIIRCCCFCGFFLCNKFAGIGRRGFTRHSRCCDYPFCGQYPYLCISCHLINQGYDVLQPLPLGGKKDRRCAFLQGYGFGVNAYAVCDDSYAPVDDIVCADLFAYIFYCVLCNLFFVMSGNYLLDGRFLYNLYSRLSAYP